MENIKKILKKISIVSMGVSMLGATMMGAMATDLSEYPNPMFVANGKFDGIIVIGADAETADMLGAMDIISSLQATTIMSGEGKEAVTSVEGDVYKFERSSNKLNFGEDLASIKNQLDDEQLPLVLADGVIRVSDGGRYEYEQEISFENTEHKLEMFSDKNYNDDEVAVGITIDRTSPVLTYSLDFNNAIYLDEMEDETIDILGETYDIVKTSATSIEVMKGNIRDTLEEGEGKEYVIDGNNYDVQVLIIDDSNSKVKFKINGEVTDSMVAGDVYATSQIDIGVREVLPNEAGDVTQDLVEFYLGAKKITFSDGDELEIDNRDIDNVDVMLDIDAGLLSEIRVTWNAAEDLFITEESTITMPGLESVKLYMEDINAVVSEELIISDDGDAVKLSAELKDYSVDLVVLRDVDSDDVFDVVGEDIDRRLITSTCGTFDVTENDQYFVVSYLDGNDAETYVLEVTDIDDVDGVTVKNYAGDDVAVDEDEDVDINGVSLTINSFNEDNQTVQFTTVGDCVDAMLFTAEGLAMSLPTSTNHVFEFTEEDINGNILAGVKFNVSANISDSDVDIEYRTKEVLSGNKLFDDGLEYVGVIDSPLGTSIYEADDDTEVRIVYAGEEKYGDVYIGSKASKVVTTDERVGVQGKIEVGAAVLDKTLASYTDKNIIVIGGPAINRAAAELLGLQYPTYGVASGIPENSALIKLVEQSNGNVAVIVAGWEASDTQRASRVLADIDNYDLSGNEVEISGTSMTDISVGTIE